MYNLARLCRVWKISRSSVYSRRARRNSKPSASRKGGRKPALTDEELLRKIRQILEESPWYGEGYRKVCARLRISGHAVSPKRVLRVMREARLLSQERPKPRPKREHNGTIWPDRPDAIWGMDLTCCQTEQGQAAVFVVLDHYTAELLSVHATWRSTREQAIYPWGRQ